MHAEPFDEAEFFRAISQVTYHDAKGQVVVKDFLQPGLRYKPPYGPLDLISLGLALIFGTAGLPHILVRFYTVPDAKTARHSGRSGFLVLRNSRMRLRSVR